MGDSPPSPDTPPNPIEKEGYRLEFHDEFDGAALDTRKWLPFHLAQWSSRRLAAPTYDIADGHLILRISEEQSAWCPEFDGSNRVSSLQTGVFAGPLGGPVGQHRFGARNLVREAQENRRTYTPQFGYFEMRAKAVASPANHVALWMIGYEDSPERSAEIAICEIMGAHVGSDSSEIGYGLHPWFDPAIRDEFRRIVLPFDARNFHIYAAEWTPDRVDFHFDNRRIGVISQSPQYPMQFMLGIYDRPDAVPTGAPIGPYPKDFVIDYFRAYQPAGGY